MSGRGGGRRSATTTSVRKRKKNPQNHQNLSSLVSLAASATNAVHSFLSQNDLNLHPSQTLTLESKITSTALSLTKLHSLLQTLNPPKTSKSLIPPPALSSSSSPSSSWFQRFLSSFSNPSDPQWIEAFRMSKPSFNLLLQTLSPSLQHSPSDLPPDYMLGVTLFRLAHGASFKSAGRRFGVDSAIACRAFYEVCKAVNDQMGHLFEFSSVIRRVLEGFGWISLPNCCGVLGFSRFPIIGKGLEKDGEIIVQGLVDSEGRFLDVSAGWPSSVNPDSILRQTRLYARVEESKELLNGPLIELNNGNLIPQYLIGDPCCPLMPWLLTPFPKSSNADGFDSLVQQAFNSAHNRGMELVHKAFRRLRARWRLLSMIWREECTEFFPFVIVTCCILHNFLLKCGEGAPDDNEECSDEQRMPVFDGKGDENGEMIRNALALHLSLKANQDTSNAVHWKEDARL